MSSKIENTTVLFVVLCRLDLASEHFWTFTSTSSTQITSIYCICVNARASIKFSDCTDIGTLSLYLSLSRTRAWHFSTIIIWLIHVLQCNGISLKIWNQKNPAVAWIVSGECVTHFSLTVSQREIQSVSPTAWIMRMVLSSARQTKKYIFKWCHGCSEYRFFDRLASHDAHDQHNTVRLNETSSRAFSTHNRYTFIDNRISSFVSMAADDSNVLPKGILICKFSSGSRTVVPIITDNDLFQ